MMILIAPHAMPTDSGLRVSRGDDARWPVWCRGADEALEARFSDFVRCGGVDAWNLERAQFGGQLLRPMIDGVLDHGDVNFFGGGKPDGRSMRTHRMHGDSE